MYRKGIRAELEASNKLHQKHLPLLISSRILRSRSCGQIDLACFEKDKLNLYEIKSRKLGKQQISPSQRARLIKSARFLGIIFRRKVELKVWDF